ncbi:MAG TPA: NAD(P)-dependent alcohol dehydrogenase [Kofleriaceae bacterium]|jgi:NADPH:quinone reductase-like Zn-dependent oxidoreductase|nr:NAD(P)-dependent alcohol dehydrogenase [Kofleriaceae bacterium]
MRAYELQPRDGFDALTLVDRAAPAVGPSDVRVHVRAVSLNFRDLSVVKGARKRKAPVVPASDGAGEVVEVGAAVTRFKVGDRVAASFFPTWLSGELSDYHHANALGGGRDGMLAEQVVLPEASWIALPARLSFEAAATLPCAGVTAYHALFEAARLRAGDVVLVQGTGGVSMFGLQLAKAAGARVIVTSSSQAKRERALALGADHVIDYKADPAWGETARAWTGGRGADIVIEVGGPGTFDQSVAALRYGGTMSILGVLTGLKGEINTYGVFHKALRVAGVYVGSVAMFEGLIRALEASRIDPIIDDRTFGFAEVRDAYAYLQSGAHFGKVVVRVD